MTSFLHWLVVSFYRLLLQRKALKDGRLERNLTTARLEKIKSLELDDLDSFFVVIIFCTSLRLMKHAHALIEFDVLFCSDFFLCEGYWHRDYM